MARLLIIISLNYLPIQLFNHLSNPGEVKYASEN